MNQIEFYFENSKITQEQRSQLSAQLIIELNKMKKALEQGYDDDRASLNLPGDTSSLQKVMALVEEKNKLHPRYVIVVGIGGSNLGSLAVFDAILGKKYNLQNNEKKILFADTVDSDLVFDIIHIIEPVLQNKEQILLNLVSKSGSTTETIANFEILLQLLEKYSNNPKESIVVTTDYDSKLWHLAKEKQYSLLEIPKKVGGRYSVFSTVGLFPLAMMGVKIEQLLQGAKQMRLRCLDEDFNKNPAAIGAACALLHFKDKKNIHDLFLFSDDLESIGKWNRQLVAESVGKEHDLSGNQVFTGLTPTYSIGSTDLHSVAQLYLGGPFDKFTSFVKVKTNKHDLIIPRFKEYVSLVQGIQQKPMQEIMSAIYNGITTAFIKGNRPFMEIILPDKSESSIGQFMQYKMMETMYLGGFLQINPFDQPNVELYKKETRNLLNKEHDH
jgi:glucose-6-phosphate isomerase